MILKKPLATWIHRLLNTGVRMMISPRATKKVIVNELSWTHREALERHMLLLGGEDRQLRFGGSLSDTAVRHYVARIDFDQDAVFGVFGHDLTLLGAAHLARGNGNAELGVSVLLDHRGRGLGGALLQRAHTHARNWGVRVLYMHCLTENAAMMHLARKQGMDIVAEAGEADALLNTSSRFAAAIDRRIALFDHALKTQLANARRLADALKVIEELPGPGK